VKWLERPGNPCASKLDADGWARLGLWLDLYGQRIGSYSDAQEKELAGLRTRWANLLQERK